MPLELGLSDAGLVVPRLADYLTEIRDSYRSDTGLDVDWDSDLFLGVITAIMARLLDQQAEGVQAIYDAFDVNAATGVQESNIAALNGVRRRKATFGQVVLTLTGTAGTIVTEGKIAEGGGSDGRARWVLTEDATIGGGGTVDVIARAEFAGRIIALGLPNPEITKIVTPVPGWTGVTNAAAASSGLDAETDVELRIRRAQSIQLSAGVGIGGIRAKVLALKYIQACAVIDNPDNEDRVIEGIAMLAHSYLVIVLPDTLTPDQKAEIGRLLYANTVPSTRSIGTDVTGTITGLDGFEKPFAFDYANEIAANIVVSYVMATGFSAADASPAHQRLVEAHIGTLQIGDPLTQLALAAMAWQIPGVLAMTATINGQANLVATAIERVVVGTWTVS